MPDTIRMADARREHVLRYLTVLDSQHKQGRVDDKEYLDRLRYFNSRLEKFQSDEDTLGEVERRDFGWTPSGYATIREDTLIEPRDGVYIDVTRARAQQVREALACESAKASRDAAQIDYLESRLPRFENEEETLLEVEKRAFGWTPPTEAQVREAR